MVKDGVEDTQSSAVQEWAGAHETYSIRDVAGGVNLTVEMDATDEYRQYFEETWPKALARLKRMCEGKREKQAG
jgi:phosphoribosylformylglycinamidine (FGAM) synthase PurS component